MKRGPWHQMGDRSQKLVAEMLEKGKGVGAIISPKDLASASAIKYSDQYHDFGADVLLDPQFFLPAYSNSKLDSYPTNEFRMTISSLGNLKDAALDSLTAALIEANANLGTDAVIAPSAVYEAGRQDIDALNEKLFLAGKRAGDALSVPTYATVVLGHSIIATKDLIDQTLATASRRPADGWYFAFEYSHGRIPSSVDEVNNCLSACLSLACTGKPVLQAFAGPQALLSFGSGATACAIGHWQNLWQFSRERWEESEGQGGGSDAPPRFFSKSLWGTIIYPDEVEQLPSDLRDRILTTTEYSEELIGRRGAEWSRWSANKHLVDMIIQSTTEIASQDNPLDCAASAQSILENAVSHLEEILDVGIELRDDSSSYQANWILAIDALLKNRADDFSFLELTRNSVNT